MREEFRFDPCKDNANDYLTKMSPLLYAIETGDTTGVDRELFDSLSDEEKKEIPNEAYKAYAKPLKQATIHAFVNVNGSGRQKMEDFEHDLYLYIRKEIGKFNNPYYMENEEKDSSKKDGKKKEKYSIDTFIAYRVAKISQRMWNDENNVKEHDGKRMSHIKKIIEALVNGKGVNPGKITAEMIFENQKLAKDKMELTLEQVEFAYLNMHRTRVSWETILESDGKSDTIKMDGIEYEETVSSFRSYFDKLEDYEKYIYCKALHMWDGEIGIRDISSDNVLIRMIINHPRMKKYIYKRNKELIRVRHCQMADLSYDRYVAMKFVKDTIEKVQSFVVASFAELDLTSEEKCMCLNYLLNIDWNDFG